MDRNNDKIMSNQLFSILVMDMIGVGILSLPSTLAQSAGPDSLIVLVMGSILFLIQVLIIQRLVTKFPKKTIIEITKTILFKPMGILIGFLYLIYFLLITSLEVRAFGEITKNFLLPKTPIEIIIITFLLTSIYLVRSGIESIARLAVIALPLSVIPSIIVIMLAIPDLDFTAFLPVLHTPLPNLIKALPKVFFSYIGFEVILVLGIFIKDTKNIRKASIKSIGFISIIYFIFTAMTIARFGIAENKNLIWPVVTLFKSVNLPGTLLENVEVVIMGTWLLSIFMTVAIAYFGCVLLLSRILKSKEHNYLSIILLPMIYVLSLIPENVAQVYDYMDIFAKYLTTIFAVIIPILLLLISLFIRGSKKGMKKNV
ncbi:GerAB/ArcD/ProY family transporter [Maledivibacter halophilus]|uniref:Spore germination protein n=1 Tax=Maledivibacter halophilus TaxID=36842 RepID=A0A1T5K4X4_9FIRM|nr:endospore germination permease [Maledivibacter halophilus]SKC58508.1 spore germination protein [Maledivibacter halophilus]